VRKHPGGRNSTANRLPDAVFGAQRAEILQGFLGRARIFATDWFRDKYEQQARRNLQASISKLRQPSR